MSWSDYFLPDSAQTSAEQQSNYERQQAELAAKVAERQAAGTITAEQVQFYQGNQGELESQDAAAAAGFVEGAKEGLQNVLEAPGKAVDAVGGGLTTLVGGILKGVPWWLWLVAGAALFFYMGGATLLRGRLAKL